MSPSSPPPARIFPPRNVFLHALSALRQMGQEQVRRPQQCKSRPSRNAEFHFAVVHISPKVFRFCRTSGWQFLLPCQADFLSRHYLLFTHLLYIISLYLVRRKFHAETQRYSIDKIEIACYKIYVKYVPV